ncbi:hypothetical protein BMW23_0094 [Bodo saltans virus]|uniref:Uncharacterized protein n=1 Tax=Bodo saltans virus TaxID=2024608 RepID=A0A2H4UTF3_9VIRU|nr:hypothetical protein QJ851_gp0091 [Bodo saltans virus]ATZ80154.1 hypothetical protein BMW23_0094 [Bodo saltans virus]
MKFSERYYLPSYDFARIPHNFAIKKLLWTFIFYVHIANILNFHCCDFYTIQ